MAFLDPKGEYGERGPGSLVNVKGDKGEPASTGLRRLEGEKMIEGIQVSQDCQGESSVQDSLNPKPTRVRD